MPDLSPEAQEAVLKVEKLLRLAGKNQNEHEAAAAAAKAQEILAQHNLDMSVVEANSGASSGKREDAKVKGGLYHYQRDLWRAVADLNFCMYWNQYNWDKDKSRVKVERYRGEIVGRTRVKGGYKFEHRVVGRMVNTAATRVMAQYLEQAIERLARERVVNPSEFFTRWAISYREGMAETVIDKIYERRKHILAEEKQKAREAARRAAETATAGHSTATALTLADVSKSEQIANFDFVHGEGAWEKKLQREAARAKAARDEEARYTQWAKDNPEEARALEEKERNRRVSYGPRSYQDTKKRDQGAFRAGMEAGSKIGIDPQADTQKTAGLLR